MDSTDFKSEFHLVQHNRRERLRIPSGYYPNSSEHLSATTWENPLVVHHYNPNFGSVSDPVLDYPHCYTNMTPVKDMNYIDNLMSMNYEGYETASKVTNVGEFCSSNGQENTEFNSVTLASSGTRNGNSQSEPDDSSWMNRPVGINVDRWNNVSSCNIASKCDQDAIRGSSSRRFVPGGGRQGLSLSLSSGMPYLESLHGSSSGNANNPRHIAPLGPFTGYATILKSSRFLKPTQEMLDEVCSTCVGSKIKNLNVADVYVDDATAEDGEAAGTDDCGDMFSARRSGNEVARSSSYKCSMPENQEANAKLMRLLDEVCRRYRLHNEQIQMVVSSFESVAGLDSSTPFISLALKRISKSFQRLKITISNQLKLISNSFKDKNTNNNNNGVQNHKYSCGGNIESQQHTWKPQRGLPERAVAILRTWLFDHFLHPYPTDSDKQMLACQTGLSRNQVSNWFINARVRVWKPMVEEIHTLETKASTPTTTNQTRSNTNENNGDMILYQEKRSRTDYTRSHLDESAAAAASSSSMVGLNQRNGFEIGVGNVSLTLGLKFGVEGIQTQEQQEQRLGMMGDDDRFGCGHVMLHDLLG